MKLLALYAALSILAPSTVVAQTEPQKVEERPTPSRDGSTVFGLLLGNDTLAEVASKVQLQSRSICESSRSREECKSTYEIKSFDSLKNKDYSVDIGGYSGVPNNAINVLFAKFSVDGEYLTGTFFNDTLVALSVTGRYGDHLDSDIDAKALMASFDKKYKRQAAPLVKASTRNGVTEKYTYHVWKDTTGTFSVHLTRLDSILINELACLEGIRPLASLSGNIYNVAKLKCIGTFVEYELDYRASTMYLQAFGLAQQFVTTEKAAKDKAAKKQVGKY